ncbi:diguanylate cyclase (GGDEF) domain-containing protein [Desulfosporosinus acidiphilus SJ4]|uniref:Diguanylate cyclase (GGDEF) domain-containing protein n=1 Tax=Desulfosporosinus acidiphilus (strain DSM 22704 / JCM 16185 / SJ4) TaxID=646529 RepID=I4D1D9_DESAJ|nr:GGDEF domain-containing protein [Desulfosporosinus acidiphilus]AFM39613.1 diguanylate cyclase (GGDEF) domain-containing protein [Desulfosporosinus acidiphilus SJ4]
MRKLGLLIAMILTGIFYSIILLYFMDKPLFNNLFLHCLIMGILYGLTNFIIFLIYDKQLDKIKRLNYQLKSSLLMDNMTGLLNRRAFDQDINKVINYGVYSLIFLDIDNFRDFNNHFGHAIGDMVLKKVGKTIKTCVRATDRVYRYGGEEIVLFLSDCEKANAIKMAEKIRSKICQLDNGEFPQVTVSLGVSSYPDDGRSIHEVIAVSDKALLKAKLSGKNCTISS